MAFRTSLRLGVALALAGVAAPRVEAQVIVTGRVADPQGLPLGGVRISLEGEETQRAFSRSNGAYSLRIGATRSSARPAMLLARTAGYTVARKPIELSSGPHQVDFVLQPDPSQRDAVIQSASATPLLRRELPVSIGLVSGVAPDELPPVNAAGLLRGRVAGLHTLQPSGDPASAPSLRLRGATSMSQSQESLLVIDGTITRGTLADIPAEDIERIEVLKGPASSALYGSDAAAGVIQVFTRRGSDTPEGSLVVRARNEMGASSFSRRLPGVGAHPYQVTTGPDGKVSFVRDANGNRVLEPDRIADNPYPAYFDNQSALFRSGFFFLGSAQVTGRTGGTNFFGSFQDTHSPGTIIELAGFRRRSLRLNLDQRIGSRIDLGVGIFHTGSDDSQIGADASGPFFGLRFVEPYVDLLARNPDGSKYAVSLPDPMVNARNELYVLGNDRRNAARLRTIGGATARWSPVAGVSVEAHAHFDHESQTFSDVRIPGYLVATPRSVPHPTPGSGLYDVSANRLYDAGGQVALRRNWGRLSGALALGYIHEHGDVRDSTQTGPLLEAPTSTSGFRTGYSADDIYGTAHLTVSRRYIFDGIARRDKNSSLWLHNTTTWSYRIAAAWLAKEDLHLRGLGDIRVRAAYGAAGARPLTTPLGLFVIRDTTLRPERSRELELGLDLVNANGRLGVEYSYSRKRTSGQINLVSLPSVSGFPQALLNAGEVTAQTHELTIRAQLVNRPKAEWRLELTGDRTRQRITQYPLPERLSSFGQQPNAFYFAKGSSLGEMYGNRLVKKVSELYDDPAKQALSGPGQSYDPANFVVNEDGYVVAKASWRCADDLRYRDTGAACTTPERPITYITCRSSAASGSCAETTSFVRIGDANPDFNLGVHSRIRYGPFSFTTLVDWSQGGNIYNGSRQWAFFAQQDNTIDQRGKPEAAKKSTSYYTTFFNGFAPLDFFVESASYLRVRELTLSYALSARQLSALGLGAHHGVRFGVAARNLVTLSGYSGLDPETASQLGDPFLYRIDWYAYPNFRTISGFLDITF